MGTLELELLKAGHHTHPRLSAFDYVTKLFVPIVAIIVAGIAKNLQPWQFGGLLTFAFISFSAGFYNPALSRYQYWAERRQDRRVARKSLVELRKFVHRFEQFIDGQTSTLHYIAQGDVCNGDGQLYNSLGLPELSVWHAFHADLMGRLDRMDMKRASISELRHDLQAFFNIIGTYNNSCVSILFDRLPRSPHINNLTPKAKSSLNSFQQRFTHFLEEYKNFAKDLSESRPALADVNYLFSIPKPIS